MRSPRRGSARRAAYLVATDSPAINPAALGVLTACDGVLLLIQEGRTPIPGARRLVELHRPAAPDRGGAGLVVSRTSGSAELAAGAGGGSAAK